MDGKRRRKGLAFSVKHNNVHHRILRSDPVRIRQIAFNLLSNAIKFTETGGIEFGISQKKEPDGVVETRFEVTDSGPGIPSEKFPILFDKFTQADASVTRKYGGSGLGLAVSRELATLLGGDIGVESEVGIGSTFWFSIRCEEGSRGLSPPPNRDMKPTARRHRSRFLSPKTTKSIRS